MSALAFTLARLGFLVLLWVFVAVILRALRQDMGQSVGQSAPSILRQSRKESSPLPRKRGATRLVITEGPLAGSIVPLSPTSIIIGRSPASTLVLDDTYVSSRHARVFPQDGSWWLEDLGSTNGTLLANEPVHGTVELPMSVPVRIGQTTLELRP